MHYYNEDSYQSDDDVESLASDMVVDDPLDLESLEEPKIKKKRIREKLDHLTHEEKLMRRKMKNRVSAQSARDRKRKQMSTLEKKIEVLCEDRQKILKENAILKRQNEQIIKENSELKKRLSEIESRLSSMSRSAASHQLPIQINAVQTTTSTSPIPPEQYKMNSQFGPEQSALRADARLTSLKPAAFISGTQQKDQDVQAASAHKSFGSKAGRKVQSLRNKELLALIRQLISLFMMTKTNATTCSASSKTATKICLTQTLRRLRQLLPKQQMRLVLSNVIQRLVTTDRLKVEHIQRFKSALGRPSSSSSSGKSLYQKPV